MYPQNISPSFTLNVLCVGVVVEDSLNVLYCLEVMHVIDDVLIYRAMSRRLMKTSGTQYTGCQINTALCFATQMSIVSNYNAIFFLLILMSCYISF